MKKKKHLLITVCTAALLIVFFISPLYPYLRSLAVMSVYSHECAKESIMEKENFDLQIPSGENWYPFVMTFTADNSFSAYTKIPDTKLTILYNFPAFSLKKGCSRLFDEASPYYSSFYGAYLVRRTDGEPFGFSRETYKLDENALSSVAEFDFFSLVLGDFGLMENERIFDYEVTSREEGLAFAGYDGWTLLSSDITVNGANHEKNGFVTSYLQYGSPSFPVSSDFAPVKMKSIVCAKYFEEWNTSVFFYVMSPSEAVCKECVQTILSRSTLKSEE